jgi:hypothetical protein
VNPNSDVSHAARLSSTQEEYFLDLFWQTYHVVYPVLNEAEFKDHYQSLWSPEVVGNYRSGPESSPNSETSELSQ